MEDIEKREEYEVIEIKPRKEEGEGFPGYDKVRLSYNQLKGIVIRRPSDWINALSNQQAVYLITDLNNGKHYVGSATSNSDMLLARWSNYVENGHGGNKELIEIAKNPNSGFDYIKHNFQYSILENFNSRTDPHIVKEREKWWKKALDSAFPNGYNDN